MWSRGGSGLCVVIKALVLELYAPVSPLQTLGRSWHCSAFLFCVSEPETITLAELQQKKRFLKLLKRQEKELRELEWKGSKQREELLQKYSVLFSELPCPGDKKRTIRTRKTQKKR